MRASITMNIYVATRVRSESRGVSNSIAKYCNTFGMLQYFYCYILRFCNKYFAISIAKISKLCNTYCKILKVLQYFESFAILFAIL